MDRQTKVLVTLLIVSLAVGMLVAVGSVGALANGEYTVSTILAEFEVTSFFRGFRI